MSELWLIDDRTLGDLLANVSIDSDKKRAGVAILTVTALSLLFAAGVLSLTNLKISIPLLVLGALVWLATCRRLDAWTRAERWLAHVLEKNDRPGSLPALISHLATGTDNSRQVIQANIARILLTLDDGAAAQHLNDVQCQVLVVELARMHRLRLCTDRGQEAFMIGALKAIRVHQYLRALPTLRRIPFGDYLAAHPAVAAALSDCFSHLEAERQRRVSSGALLRSSARPEDPFDMFLSPARQPGDSEGDPLLRATSGSEPEPGL
jgi:hypothetical protein